MPFQISASGMLVSARQWPSAKYSRASATVERTLGHQSESAQCVRLGATRNRATLDLFATSDNSLWCQCIPTLATRVLICHIAVDKPVLVRRRSYPQTVEPKRVEPNRPGHSCSHSRSVMVQCAHCALTSPFLVAPQL